MPVVVTISHYFSIHLMTVQMPLFLEQTPYGIKREMLLSGGGSELRGFTMAWDTKWKCKTAIKEDHYIAEMIIPLSAFKYREGETKWRFNSYQFDTQDNVEKYLGKYTSKSIYI